MKNKNLREFLKVCAEDFTTKYKCTPKEAFIEGGQRALEGLWHNTSPTQYTTCVVLIQARVKDGTFIGPRLATYVPSFKKLGEEPWVIHYQSKDRFKGKVEILKWLDLNDVDLDI